jgi:hypothetical protein
MFFIQDSYSGKSFEINKKFNKNTTSQSSKGKVQPLQRSVQSQANTGNIDNKIKKHPF